MDATNESNMLDDLALDDDELYSLFSAFDEVKASEELQNDTLARILALSEENDCDAAKNAEARTPGSVKARSGGKAASGRARTKWRTIRVAAVAACLAMALSGGIAYATPTAYYEVSQDESVITLGVNCFGITVSATSDDDDGKRIIESTDLHGMPYEDSLARTVEAMEQLDPTEPIEYGPRGGEHETIPAAQPDGPEGDDGAGVGNGAGNAPGGNPGEMQGDPNAGSGNQAPGNVGGGPDDTGEPFPEGEGSPQGNPRP